MLTFFVRLFVTAAILFVANSDGWIVGVWWRTFGWDMSVGVVESVLFVASCVVVCWLPVWFFTSPNGIGQVRRLKFNFGVPIAVPRPGRRRVRRVRGAP